MQAECTENRKLDKIEENHFNSVEPILEQDEINENMKSENNKSKRELKTFSNGKINIVNVHLARTISKENKLINREKQSKEKNLLNSKVKEENYVFKARSMPEYPSLELKLSTTNLTIPHPPKLTSCRNLNHKK